MTTTQEPPEVSDTQVENFAATVGIQIDLDGDQWFARLGDFSDLQESPAGFGYTKWDALKNLIKEY